MNLESRFSSHSSFHSSRCPSSHVLVPTVTLRTKKARRLFYDSAAEGVNLALQAEIDAGFLPEAILDEVAIIANVFVHPSASIAKRVSFNNYKAMRQAVRKAIGEVPGGCSESHAPPCCRMRRARARFPDGPG